MKTALSALVLLATVVMLGAQDPAALPTFEVASVRLVPSANGLPEGFAMNPRRRGDRWSWTTNPYRLVSYAFHVPTWRVEGLSFSPPFYRIEASMDAAATEDEVRLMLRQVLIDRFKLATHTRAERRPGYALVLVDDMKLQRAAATGTVPPMPAYMPGQPPAAFEGAVFTSAEGTGVAALTGRGVPLTRMAETLSEEFEAFVTDETGKAGNFYFGFTFRRLDYPNTDATDAPSLFDALEDELGLQLERREGPVEFLVVDHVEPPTPN